MLFKKKHSATLLINGMSCAHCAARVEKALGELGISAKVNLAEKSVEIKSNEPFDQERIFAAISNIGFIPVKLEEK